MNDIVVSHDLASINKEVRKFQRAKRRICKQQEDYIRSLRKAWVGKSVCITGQATEYSYWRDGVDKSFREYQYKDTVKIHGTDHGYAKDLIMQVTRVEHVEDPEWQEPFSGKRPECFPEVLPWAFDEAPMESILIVGTFLHDDDLGWKDQVQTAPFFLHNIKSLVVIETKEPQA